MSTDLPLTALDTLRFRICEEGERVGNQVTGVTPRGRHLSMFDECIT